MENTVKPCSSSVSTMAPRGISMAAANRDGASDVCRRSHAANSARLSPLCSIHRSAMIWPSRPVKQTRCLSEPQSIRQRTEKRCPMDTSSLNSSTCRVEHQPLYRRSVAGRKLPTGSSPRATESGRKSGPGVGITQGHLGAPDRQPSPYCLTHKVGEFKGTGGTQHRFHPLEWAEGPRRHD